MRRKEFLMLGTLGALAACGTGNIFRKDDTYTLVQEDPAKKFGHILRDGLQKAASVQKKEKRILIIGAGISGLSAAWMLKKQGIEDFAILELEKQPGGNSAYSKNDVSAYPLGAHYLPLPNRNYPELTEFLEKSGVISGYDPAGLPVYNENYLCHEPEERLFIRNQWQEGLVPDYGLNAEDRAELKRFFAYMERFKEARGADGKEAFAVPVEYSSRDEAWLAYDDISFAGWLQRENFRSPALLWYVGYCVKDDYGTEPESLSAWNGIHYFACRKGKAANAESSDVLTWPEGNGFLMEKLRSEVQEHILLKHMAYSVSREDTQKKVSVLRTDTQQHIEYSCRELVMAIPLFIAARMLNKKDFPEPLPRMSYGSWLLANITLKREPGGRGFPLSWDNVLYGSRGLGYVNACHQNLQVLHDKIVITYYHALTGADPVELRKKAEHFDAAEWNRLVMDDLKTAHPDMEQLTEHIELRLLGHAMPSPVPGTMRRVLAGKNELPADIHFCHSELSGYSVFEEAFYQGCECARRLIKTSV